MSQNNNETLYRYFLNYEDNYKDLCDLEMLSLFGFIPKSKSFSANNFINPARSTFLTGYMTISYIEENLAKLCQAIENDKLYYDDYKITYIKSEENDIFYEDRLKALRMVGLAILGDFNLQNPKIEFALTKVNQKWIFGEYIKNIRPKKSKPKPFNYSYALEHKLAKTLINISVGNNLDLKVVDPCCGIGTVVIEGRNLGLDITGFDINPNVVKKCNKNLSYFGFTGDVKEKNISEITNFYDVAIVDLPYGKFTKVSLAEQKFIINQTRKIAKKAVFITMDKMDAIFINCGFTVKEQCQVQKRDKFSRYITVCY